MGRALDIVLGVQDQMGPGFDAATRKLLAQRDKFDAAWKRKGDTDLFRQWRRQENARAEAGPFGLFGKDSLAKLGVQVFGVAEAFRVMQRAAEMAFNGAGSGVDRLIAKLNTLGAKIKDGKFTVGSAADMMAGRKGVQAGLDRVRKNRADADEYLDELQRRVHLNSFSGFDRQREEVEAGYMADLRSATKFESKGNVDQAAGVRRAAAHARQQALDAIKKEEDERTAKELADATRARGQALTDALSNSFEVMQARVSREMELKSRREEIADDFISKRFGSDPGRYTGTVDTGGYEISSRFRGIGMAATIDAARVSDRAQADRDRAAQQTRQKILTALEKQHQQLGAILGPFAGMTFATP